MVNTRITSFIMAVTMALWSPAWCCCGVFGSALSSSACAAPTAPSNQFESAASREVKGYCRAIRATESLMGAASSTSPSNCCEPSPGPTSTPNDDPSTCGCGDHSRDANIGRVAVLPIPGEVDFQVVETLAWTPAMVVPNVARFGWQARTARAGPGLPCADSLLLRHCLLTI